MGEENIFYRRHLPHWHPRSASYHVTFRLDGSLPDGAIRELRREREEAERDLVKFVDQKDHGRFRDNYRWGIFRKFDHLLDGASYGPVWLRQREIALIVKDAIHSHDDKDYSLFAYTIMPNHVHLVFQLICKDLPQREETTRTKITTVSNLLRLIKGSTAHDCNELLHRKGQFWLHESYDHVIHNEKELAQTIRYVLNNPVKAGFVKMWQEWEWNYYKPELSNKIILS